MPGVAKSAAAIVALMALGGGAAFLVLGRLAPPPAARVSATPSPSLPSAVSCSATPAPPAPLPAATPSSAAFPASYWVNDPLGVNLRSGPSASSSKLSTLTQGTQMNATSQTTDSSGNRWDNVTTGGQTGWVRADFIVPIAIHPAGGDGFSLMLPAGYSVKSSQATIIDFQGPVDRTLPFLRAQTANKGGIGVQLPDVVRADVPARTDHTKVIQVWSYTAVEQVSRVALDACKAQGVQNRVDHGWPFMTSVIVQAPSRSYAFTFFSSQPDDPIVDQVLNSVAMS
jgi:hypothetical protein